MFYNQACNNKNAMKDSDNISNGDSGQNSKNPNDSDSHNIDASRRDSMGANKRGNNPSARESGRLHKRAHR